MALSLTAEQKDILKILKIEEQYIIPSFQRPYSWEYDQCFQLYNDLFQSFQDNEDYFIGNLIIAKNDENKNVLEVVDGQQRLITLLLFIKACSLRNQDLKVLKDLLFIEDWEGKKGNPRIKSEVFEANDEQNLIKVLGVTDDELKLRYNSLRDKNGTIKEAKCDSKFEANLLNIYNWITYLEEKRKLREFIEFLLRRVYLLPIELIGKTSNEALDKALVIFETINNRGMNLEDADIFKAKLFKKAKKVLQEQQFIDQWKDFKVKCENLEIEIDDVFRYYSHTIRGAQGITIGEKNLREFFLNETFSPFETKSYSEVFEDLFKIIDILEFLRLSVNSNRKYAKWLQILSIYTNKYPQFAIVTYLFINSNILCEDNFNHIDDEGLRFEYFLVSIIRYVYFQGSTATVKFEIYNIIRQVCNNIKVNSYSQDISEDFFDRMGRLKNGYALIAYYMDNPDPLTNVTFDRILNKNEKIEFSPVLSNEQYEKVVESIANILVFSGRKKGGAFKNRMSYYSQISIDKSLLTFLGTLTLDSFQVREKHLMKNIRNFFYFEN